jgi:hypothetical protein
MVRMVAIAPLLRETPAVTRAALVAVAALVAAVEAIAPPLRETPAVARAALAAAVGAIAPPLQETLAVAAPQTRAALAAVGATRAEQALPTRAPRAAPTTPSK